MESTKYYLGLDVGGTNMVAGVVDENHQIIAKESIPTQAGRTIEEITADMLGKDVKIYNLQGVRVNTPTTDAIHVIVSNDGTVRKVVIK